jgi:hypothetical protein
MIDCLFGPDDSIKDVVLRVLRQPVASWYVAAIKEPHGHHPHTGTNLYEGLTTRAADLPAITFLYTGSMPLTPDGFVSSKLVEQVRQQSKRR